MAHSSFAERALYFFGLGLGRLIYRVKITGQANLPPGGFLLLPNHITWVDAIVLQLACPRRIRFIIHEEYYRNRWLHPFLRVAGCIPINVEARERCHPGGGGKNQCRGDRLSFPGRATFALRDIAAVAARL